MPALGAALADVHGPRAERQQPLQLGFLVPVGGADVDVQPELAGARVAAGAEDEGGLRAAGPGAGRPDLDAPVVLPAQLPVPEDLAPDVCAGFEAELREFNGEADHVHLLVHYPPKVVLSKLINSLKGVSSRYLRAEYTERINRIGTGSAFWSRSYFAGSCGGAPLTMIRQYIEGQKRPV